MPAPAWVPDAERLAAYYGDNDELQLGFNIPFAFAGFDPPRLATLVGRTLAALPPGACPAWMGSNHDLGRFPSRWCGGDERRIRLALLLLATLPGTSVLYYGDEIGMTDVDVPVALRRDHATLDVDLGADRDRARTPLPWDGSPGGGFTGPGVTPWLPLADPPAATVAGRELHRSAGESSHRGRRGAADHLRRRVGPVARRPAPMRGSHRQAGGQLNRSGAAGRSLNAAEAADLCERGHDRVPPLLLAPRLPLLQLLASSAAKRDGARQSVRVRRGAGEDFGRHGLEDIERDAR